MVPILKEYSGKKYGRKREFVDAEMAARLWVNETPIEAPVSADAVPASEATATT
jgi:hypothetical protein